MKSIIKITGILLICISLFHCGPTTDPKTNEDPVDTVKTKVYNNQFNEDTAYQFIQKQVDFGPRVPNGKSHQKCGDYLISTLKKYADTVYVQAADIKNYDNSILKSRNIIGSFNPKAAKRVLLCAHWDTRPQADEDKQNKTTPADGANDGGSGVGVLLEIARQLKIQAIEIGVDIIFFDAEDGGSQNSNIEDSWCLGSQYWAKNPHLPNYSADFGILLDMVGAKNAQFAREGMSVKLANDIVLKVWQTANSLGYSNHFINFDKSGITDDHVYVNFYRHIPTIDIIEFDQKTESGFGAYWHTHQDNMSVIDKSTLKAVGKTVLQVLYNEK